ncbi:MAG: hypothetical protein JW966_08840 [Anaerolineae bacterium]|nr:hypothetical protein [Anaerolineae bacterium]
MTALNQLIDNLTGSVLIGSRGLEQALGLLERWINDHAAELTGEDRQAFSASLAQNGAYTPVANGDNVSLIDSVLKLHTARLLHRMDAVSFEVLRHTAADDYTREEFAQVINVTEQELNDARIDIAIANAHHLLGDVAANRRWLQSALDHLPDLATIDLVAIAEHTPPPPPPRLAPLKRLGLNLIGFSFNRLAQYDRANLVSMAQHQVGQIVILAHLVGESFNAIHDTRRAQRAFRITAHLVLRHNGLTVNDPQTMLDIATSLQPIETQAAYTLAEQACDLFKRAGDSDGYNQARALVNALLS